MTRFTLQISDQLNTWLTEQAALNHRSKNKQIEHLLDMAKSQKDDDKARQLFEDSRRTGKTPGPIPPRALVEIMPADIEKFLKDQGG